MDSVIPKKSRDRKGTEAKILLAVGHLIERDGIDKLTISAVSRQAGANKALIYRYFESFEGLVDQYASDTINQHLRQIDRVDLKTVKQFLPAVLAALRNNKTLRQILVRDLKSGKMPLAEAHEKLLRQMLVNMKRLPSDIDIPSLCAVLLSGMYMMTVWADDQPRFLGLDLSQDQGWERMEYLLEKIIAGFIYQK